MPTFTIHSGMIHIQQVVLLAFVVSASACQPRDVTPGLWLSGEVVDGIVDDWAFTNDIEEIFIQTKTWYLLPHSTTIWCAEMNGELYIGSYADEKKRWENNIARNPAARLRIDGKLYDVKVTPVTSARATSEIDARYTDKYDMEEVFGENLPKWWYYRVSQRS
ncbi:MAG: DUF2255 family protein [Gammaproteobacteria bacterium]|nr:DUF2255 family protein [Gammaproteobacteria bacterium]